ncbi:MAG: leucine-rich repeat protein [Clostridia bacterium]|nr:leucine-rich repeat protein [Clostridia bacterium]
MEKQITKNPEAEIDGYVDMQTKFEAYVGNEPYLFVSYSHRDTAQVYPILDALYDCKYRLWYDESCETGNDFRDELRHRIEDAEAVLLFVSKSSLNSPFCGMEIIVARENGKRLYPIYLDSAPVPPAFQILLANTHHSTADNMDKLIKSMIRDLPAVTMDRLTAADGVLLKCEDNGNSIEVDEGIREISAEAFKGRRALHHIKLPETLESIGLESFRGCTNLKEMEIPEKTLRIGESAFRDCTDMKRLVVKNNCIKIGERAFENCADLTDVQLPGGLTEIYGGVFNSCKSLRRIDLPEKLTILGESAFSDCVVLESINIPATVTKIDDLAFNGCISMTKVELHEGLKKIGKSAFKNCRALTNISLPSTVTNISNAPFRGCESLKSIRVESKNKNYKSEPNKREGNDHVLFNKNKSVIIAYPASSREVQYDIPDSVTVISDWAFCECKKLNRITIPDSVHEIGEGSFCNCALLDEVEIPDSVTTIDDCVFRGCTSLERVIVPSSVTELGWGLFDGCESIVTVYCDEGSMIQDYCRRNGIREARISEKGND